MAAKIVSELADRLARQITQERWAVGQKLPSVRTLASEARVSINTLQAALRHLEGRGLIECQPRRGNFIAATRTRKQAQAGAAATDRAGQREGTTRSKQIGFVRYITPGQVGDRPDVLAQRDAWGDNILHGIEQSLTDSDHHLTLLTTTGQKNWTQKLLKRIEQIHDQLAGVVLYAMRGGIEQIIATLDDMAIPWVTINRFASHQTHNFVCTDYLDAGHCVGRLLLGMGCRRVVVLGVNVAGSVSSVERALGVTQAWLMAGRSAGEIHLLDCRDWFETSAAEAMQAYLETHEPPCAVLTSGDFQCLGVMDACRQWGLRVPEDVVVIGSSGLELSRLVRPSLTLVEQPMTQIGHQAAMCLMEMVQQRRGRIAGCWLPGRLVLRGSTGKISREQAAAAATPRTAVVFE